MLMKIQDNNVTQAAKNNSEKKEQQILNVLFRLQGEECWRRSMGKDDSLSKSKKNPLSFLFKRESSFSSTDKVTGSAQISLVLLGHGQLHSNSCATDQIYPHVGSNKCEYNNHHSSWKLFAQFDLIFFFRRTRSQPWIKHQQVVEPANRSAAGRRSCSA